jgi:hypothetical protein
VPRTAENLIKGFITLLPNGEATYEQLAQSGVIAEAAAQIETAMSTLGISWELIVSTFRGIWDSLSLEDLLDPIAAFVRIVDRFGEPISRLFEFISVVVKVVVSLILRLMNFPSDLLANIIANIERAVADIQRDPVQFILNMLEALKAGFMGFFDHVGTYLLQGLTAWLFRGLGQLGITIPTDFTLPSILQLVLDVLGLSIETLWTKLGEHIGPERVAMIRGAIDHLTGAWAFIQDVQQRGLVAIWEYVTDQLSGLWDSLLQMAQDWIQTTIINNVIQKLISMLDPTGIMAVVNSFIAFFRAVQSAIDYLREILEIVDKYVSTVAEIAAGNIQPGAQMVEAGLASAIPVAIGFLANQVGIGDIPEKIVEIIQRLRALVDQALDWLIAQAIRLGQAALGALGFGAQPEAAQPAIDQNDVRAVAGMELAQALEGNHEEHDVEATIDRVRTELAPRGLTELRLTPFDEEGVAYVEAAASPGVKVGKVKKPPEGKTVTARLRATLHFDTAAAAAQLSEGRTFREDIVPRGRGGSEAPEEFGAVRTAVVAPPTSSMLPGRRIRMPRPGQDLPPAPRGVVMLEPGAGATSVRLASWNTGEPVPETNDSHAERQFLDWFSPSQLPPLESVDLAINISPCSICAGYLDSVVSTLPKSKMRLAYDRIYYSTDRATGGPRPNCTTAEDYDKMAGKWDIVKGEKPTLTDQQKAAEITAANVKYERMQY